MHIINMYEKRKQRNVIFFESSGNVMLKRTLRFTADTEKQKKKAKNRTFFMCAHFKINKSMSMCYICIYIHIHIKFPVSMRAATPFCKQKRRRNLCTFRQKAAALLCGNSLRLLKRSSLLCIQQQACPTAELPPCQRHFPIFNIFSLFMFHGFWFCFCTFFPCR